MLFLDLCVCHFLCHVANTTPLIGIITFPKGYNGAKVITLEIDRSFVDDLGYNWNPTTNPTGKRCCSSSDLSAAATPAALAKHGEVLGDYDHEIYFLPDFAAEAGYMVAGSASIPGRHILMYYTDKHTLIHEIGHNLGMGHADRPGVEYGASLSST